MLWGHHQGAHPGPGLHRQHSPQNQPHIGPPCLFSVQFSSKDFIPPMNCRWDGPDWCAHTILCFIGLCLLIHTLYKASHTFIQFRVIMSLAAARWHSILNTQFICRQFLCPKLHPVVTVDFQVRPASGQMIISLSFV